MPAATRSMKLALRPPCTRMALRSYRSALPETPSSSSSSDDSCDSFGSDGGFASTRSAAKHSRRRTLGAEPDDAASSGSEESELHRRMESMEVGCQPAKGGRRSNVLKVAMTFPSRRAAGRKRAASEPLPQVGAECDSGEEEEEEENFIVKRALNIKENKEMLAKLMAELNKVPGLFPRRMAMSASATPRQAPRRPFRTPEARRKNPERVSRHHTRSRSLLDGPPSPVLDEDPEDRFGLVRRSRYFEECDEPPRRRAFNGTKAIPHVVRPVEEVTELELQRICSNVREKVYNSATGTTCHQCRQKTTDTKTNCRNPECVGVRGQFCGPCLKNRYGEEVRDALLNPEWLCPPCRGICNCSFCRARDGRCATGVLVYLAKYHGYGNVHAYLNSLKKELEESSQ